MADAAGAYRFETTMIHDDPTVAKHLAELLDYAEHALGAVAMPELNSDGCPTSNGSWAIPFRDAVLVFFPIKDQQVTVQFSVYLKRDTINRRPGRIIWHQPTGSYRTAVSSYDNRRSLDQMKQDLNEAFAVLRNRPIPRTG